MAALAKTEGAIMEMFDQLAVFDFIFNSPRDFPVRKLDRYVPVRQRADGNLFRDVFIDYHRPGLPRFQESLNLLFFSRFLFDSAFRWQFPQADIRPAEFIIKA